MVQTKQVQNSNFYLKTGLFFPTLWFLANDLGKRWDCTLQRDRFLFQIYQFWSEKYCILGRYFVPPPSALRMEAGSLSEHLTPSTTQAREEPHIRFC